MIPPTTTIHPQARIDPTVVLGPYVVIDQDVVIGPRCVLGPHVYITGATTIGADNRFHAGCVIGDAPQDLKYQGEPTGLEIGDGNTFREHVTIHRSSKVGEQTKIGSHNFLMAHCHVGHNCVLGDHIIIANGALLGGHVEVADRAYISAYCLLHQFVRVGTLAFMQGIAGISKDLPPFCVASGINSICGLNTVGLRRTSRAPDARLELKRLYHLLFRSRRKLSEALAAARAQFSSDDARTLLGFVEGAKRGVCADVSTRNDELTDDY